MSRGRPILTLFPSPLGRCLDVVPINPPEQLIAIEILQVYVYIILKKVKWVFKGKQIKWIGFGFAQHLGGGLASQNSRGLVWIHLQAQHTSPSSQLAPGSVNVSAYLCHSQRWFGVLLRGLESNAMRRRGMTANGGWRGSGGREVSKSGSRAATRRGTLRRTRGRRKVSKSGIRAAARGSTLRRINASRGERQAKVWRCWCTGDRGWHMERFCHAAHHWGCDWSCTPWSEGIGGEPGTQALKSCSPLQWKVSPEIHLLAHLFGPSFGNMGEGEERGECKQWALQTGKLPSTLCQW